MGKRIKIALVFRNYANWTGGIYYILNLIEALKKLDDKEKPLLVIIYWDKTSLQLVQEINYPFIIYKNYNFSLPRTKRLINRISNKIFKTKIFNDKYLEQNTADLIFPNPIDEKFEKINNKLYWIPDFQEKYLPHFFSKDELEQRREFQLDLSGKGKPIVFSSKDAESDFRKFYTGSTAKSFVLPFAVTHPEISITNPESILEKYGVSDQYFIAPNQFWRHKNHQVVIDAIELLAKDNNEHVQIVFTGKEDDYRDPEYPQLIRSLINQKGLSAQIIVLGFIPREDLVFLIKNSLAVVQPSLFEGWSTVVEDAKLHKKIIVASNLKVHKEQLNEKGIFFDPHDPASLAQMLKEIMAKGRDTVNYNYEKNVLDFAKQFMRISTELISNHA
jgi:glycosyltransferase involved in cell wall biosynthesis